MLKVVNKEKNCLSAKEVKEQIEALSVPDWIRLKKIARAYSGNGVEPDDLIQETIARALSNVRNCPRDVNFMKFLANAMKSVAEAQRKKQHPENKADFSIDDENNAILIFDKGDNVLNIPQEQAIENKKRTEKIGQRLQEVLELFKDDEPAELIIMGKEDGLSAKEIKETFDIDKKTYDTTLRRIRRTIDKHYPNGWMI